MSLNTHPTYQLLSRLARDGDLTPSAFERALILAGYIPTPARWHKFVNYLLLALGAAFTVSGIFFFFAYNWADMPPLVKFGLIEAVMVAAVALAQWFGLEQLPGKVALLVAAMLVGVLFAVFGQVYQTGADAYTLFLNWAVLILGWAIIGNLPLLWLVVLTLFNLTWGFYWSQVLNDNTWPVSLFMTGLVLLNAFALSSWEIANGLGWQTRRWANGLIATMTLSTATALMLYFIFDNGAYNHDHWFYVAPFIYMGVILLTLLSYTLVVRDLFMVTLALFSIIVVDTSWVADLLQFDCLTSIVISFVIIIQASVALFILQKIQRYWEEQRA